MVEYYRLQTASPAMFNGLVARILLNPFHFKLELCQTQAFQVSQYYQEYNSHQVKVKTIRKIEVGLLDINAPDFLVIGMSTPRLASERMTLDHVCWSVVLP